MSLKHISSIFFHKLNAKIVRKRFQLLSSHVAALSPSLLLLNWYCLSKTVTAVQNSWEAKCTGNEQKIVKIVKHPKVQKLPYLDTLLGKNIKFLKRGEAKILYFQSSKVELSIDYQKLWKLIENLQGENSVQ